MAWGRLQCLRGEAWALSLLLGGALLSTVILGFGVAGWLQRPVLFSLLLGAIVAPAFAPALIAGRTRPLGWLPAAITSAYALVYLVHAWAPEISPDGMAYHVALPAQYLREGIIRFLPASFYAQLSQGVEMLYVPAFAFGRHSATAVVHLAFLFALLALMRTYAQRQGLPPSAALLVLASPVVGIDASSAYNDLAVAAVIFAVFWFMERWRDEHDDRLLIFAGLLAGFAFAIKYTAFMAVPYALFCLGRRFSIPRVFRFAVPAALLAGPWLLKNWLFVHNPVAPFANHWFPNDVFDPLLERAYREYLGWNPDQPPLFAIPGHVLSGGFRLGGLLGPVFWLAPLVLVSRWRLALPAVLFNLPFAVNLGTRFLIPGLPFVALGIASVLARGRLLWPAVVTLHVLLGWYPITHRFADTYAWHIKDFPWRAALRLESEGDYIRRRVSEYPIFASLQNLPGGVLTYAQFADSYASSEMITGTLSRRALEMREMLVQAASPGTQPYEGWQFWFPQQRLRGVRIRETGAPDSLTATELSIYHLLEPVRPFGLNVRTEPASVEARFLMDGNPATRWRGDQDPARRAAIVATWLEPVLLSRLVLPASPSVALQVDGLGDDGQWRELSVKAVRTWFPRLDTRRDAVRALREQGIRWVLLNRDDPGRAEMRAKPPAWGVRLVAQGGGQWLFELLDDVKSVEK